MGQEAAAEGADMGLDRKGIGEAQAVLYNLQNSFLFLQVQLHF